MEYLPTLEQQWFYIEVDIGTPRNNFIIVDSEGFSISEGFTEEKTVKAIINNHNLTLKKEK